MWTAGMDVCKAELDILFVTHGGKRVGGGHISRCAALAEAFFSLGVQKITWCVNEDGSRSLRDVITPHAQVFSHENDFYTKEAPLLETIRSLTSSFCVLDSYCFSPLFIKLLSKHCQIVLLDDFHQWPNEYTCHCILNYNLNAFEQNYKKNKACLLLGPQYVLLRRMFWDLLPHTGDSLLIIPGASDLLDAGESFLRWWGRDWPRGVLVMGPLVACEKVARLCRMAAEKTNFTVLHNPPDLPERMARAQMVICTSSVTSYEALSLRKTLVVFQVAENQVTIGGKIQNQGLGRNLGFWGTWGERELEETITNPPAVPAEIPVNPRGALAAAKEIFRFFERETGVEENLKR